MIVPGNHDPYVKGSYYETFSWSENVHICKSNLEIIEESKYDIYMSGFTDFHMEQSPLETLQIKHPDKMNIGNTVRFEWSKGRKSDFLISQYESPK